MTTKNVTLATDNENWPIGCGSDLICNDPEGDYCDEYSDNEGS